uniref:Uncharacterized protein n=1 Tax=Oryza punctata TaxID=4537 RepID=A0A0E0MAF8_ORYPU
MGIEGHPLDGMSRRTTTVRWLPRDWPEPVGKARPAGGNRNGFVVVERARRYQSSVESSSSVSVSDESSEANGGGCCSSSTTPSIDALNLSRTFSDVSSFSEEHGGSSSSVPFEPSSAAVSRLIGRRAQPPQHEAPRRRAVCSFLILTLFCLLHYQIISWVTRVITR